MPKAEFVLNYGLFLLLFYIIGKIISWLWLPLRLILIVSLLVAAYEIFVQDGFFANNSITFILLYTFFPIVCILLPSLTKTFGSSKWQQPRPRNFLSNVFDTIRYSMHEKDKRRRESEAGRAWARAEEERIRRESAEREARREREQWEQQKRRHREDEEAYKRKLREEENQKYSHPYAKEFLIFDLPVTASFDEVEAKFKLLRQIFHPDKHGEGSRAQKEAEKKFKELQIAFDMLKIYFWQK
jgi:hypothetical protein